MSKIIALFIFIAGVMNFLPVFGLFSASNLANAYGIDVSDPNIEMLMRHRALLFGLLGAFLFYSIYKPAYRMLAGAAGLISMIGFIILAVMTDTIAGEIGTLVKIDSAGVVFLAVALYLDRKQKEETLPQAL